MFIGTLEAFILQSKNLCMAISLLSSPEYAFGLDFIELSMHSI